MSVNNRYKEEENNFRKGLNAVRAAFAIDIWPKDKDDAPVQVGNYVLTSENGGVVWDAYRG